MKMYICPICGKEHENTEICKPILKRLNDSRFLEKSSHYLLGILRVCKEKKLKFSDFLKEIVYLQYLGKINEPPEIKLANERDKVLVPWSYPIVMTPDLFLSYAAVYCNCRVTAFEMSEKVAIKYILGYLHELEVYDCFPEVYGWEILYTRRDILEDYNPYLSCHICLSAEYDKERMKYTVSLELPYKLEGNWRFLNYSEQSGRLILLQTYNEIFREEYRRNHCDLATEILSDDDRYKKWIEKIKNGTVTGAMLWKKGCSGSCFTSYFEECEVTLNRVRDGKMTEYFEDLPYPEGFDPYNESFYLFVLNKYDYFDKAYFFRGDFTELIQYIETSIKDNKMISDAKKKKDIIRKDIKANNVLVLSHSWICHEMLHKVELIIGVIKMYSPAREKWEEEVYLGYCKSCNRYMMMYSEYERLKKSGTLLCIIVENSIYVDKTKSDFSSCQEESLLYSFGYSSS